MTEEQKKKSIMEISADTWTLIKFMQEIKEGATVPYADLSALIGRDVQGAARGNLCTARNHLLKTKSMIFDCVHGEGIKRLTPTEAVHTLRGVQEKLRRGAKRSLHKAEKIEYERLTPEEKNILHTHASLMGALALFTGNAFEKKLLEATKAANDRLPTGKLLDVFKG